MPDRCSDVLHRKKYLPNVITLYSTVMIVLNTFVIYKFILCTTKDKKATTSWVTSSKVYPLDVKEDPQGAMVCIVNINPNIDVNYF